MEVNKVEHKETKHKSSSMKKQNTQTFSKTHQEKKGKSDKWTILETKNRHT